MAPSSLLVRRLRAAGIVAVLTALVSCEPTRPTSPFPGARPPLRSYGSELPSILTVAHDTLVLADDRFAAAFQIPADSIGSLLHVARVRLTHPDGAPATVAFAYRGATLPHSLGVVFADTDTVWVSAGATASHTGVVGRPFILDSVADIVVRREASAASQPSPFELLLLHAGTTSIEVSGAWVASRASVAARRIAGMNTTAVASCVVSAPGPTSCGVTVQIEPFFGRAGPFGAFQNPPGATNARPIDVTFSSPVTSVAVTIADPDFPGNSVTVFRNGSAAETIQFTGDNRPGLYTESTRTISGGGITKLTLTPAPRDYVAYQPLVISVDESVRLELSFSSGAPQAIWPSALRGAPAGVPTETSVLVAARTSSGTGVPNRTIELRLAPPSSNTAPINGGHFHQSQSAANQAARPLGTFGGGGTTVVVKTDAQGVATAQVNAPPFSGQIMVVARDTAGANQSEDTLMLQVKVPDLIPLSASTSAYTFFATSNHSGGDLWAGAGVEALLVRILNDYESLSRTQPDRYPKTGRKFVVTAAGLVWGGQYDISGKWSGSHAGHRQGFDVDIDDDSVEVRPGSFIQHCAEYLFAGKSVVCQVHNNNHIHINFGVRR